MTRSIIYLAFASLMLLSCKDEVVEWYDIATPQITMTVQPVFGGQNLFLDSVYTTIEGYDVKFTDIKFYMGNPSNGGNMITDAALFDFRERGTLLLNAEGDYSLYSNISAKLGIDSSVNHNDPVSFDPSSMLYISNANDMYWGWNPGFIFVKVEAKVDTIQDGNALFDHLVVFHVGKDTNIQTLNFTNLNWIDQGNDTHNLPFKLDMSQFLNNAGQVIDLKTEYSSHTVAGEEALSTKVIVNFKDALTPY